MALPKKNELSEAHVGAGEGYLWLCRRAIKKITYRVGQNCRGERLAKKSPVIVHRFPHVDLAIGITGNEEHLCGGALCQQLLG